MASNQWVEQIPGGGPSFGNWHLIETEPGVFTPSETPPEPGQRHIDFVEFDITPDVFTATIIEG
jgi:hypothetical protein